MHTHACIRILTMFLMCLRQTVRACGRARNINARICTLAISCTRSDRHFRHEEPGDEHRKVNHKTLRASMLVIPLAATPGTPATNRIEGHCYCLHFAGTPRNQ